MNTRPLLSILLPVYNTGHYLPNCLDSLIDSSYDNLEIIAIDDLSKDDSWKILKLYKKMDKRIKIYRNVKHYDKALTLNRLLRKAKGQYIAIMDAKDIVYKHKFAKQVAFLEKNPKISAVGTQCTFINAVGKKTQTSNFPLVTEVIYHRPLHGITLDFETVMINRHVLPKDALYFNPNSTLLYSDIIMKLLQFGDITNLPSLLQYRRTENPHRHTTITKIPSLIKLWLKSMDSYDYRPNFRSILSSFKLPRISTQ